MRIAYKRGIADAPKRKPLDKREEAFRLDFIQKHNRRIQTSKKKSINQLKELSC